MRGSTILGATVIAVSGSALSVAQNAGLSPATLVLKETIFDESGAVLRQSNIRQAWRADGSTASETSTAEGGRTTVTIRIRDIAAGRETAGYPDLGVRIVEALPRGFGVQGPMGREACADWVRVQGAQANSDPFVRRKSERGETVETRYDPALGCEATEVRILRDGRLATEKHMVRRSAGADESLFKSTTGLRAVTRVAWAEAHVARYGRPPLTADRQFLVALRRMDLMRPVTELDE